MGKSAIQVKALAFAQQEPEICFHGSIQTRLIDFPAAHAFVQADGNVEIPSKTEGKLGSLKNVVKEGK